MDLKQTFVLAQNVAKGRWFVVFVSFLIMAFAGGTYIFGIYSEAIKTVLDYDQETLTTLGFFKDLGGNVGIISGLINEVSPPWVVLAIGAVMNITGYLMIWLSVTQRVAKPEPWQMYLYLCIGANSQTFANTGALVTCVKNFPQSRGVVLGILKGFVGLSGAIFTQIYHAVYGNDSRSMILLLGLLPSAVSLSVMLIVRPTKVTTERNELNRFYNFLYIALALAGFLMVLIIVENHFKHFPKSCYQIVAAIAILFLFLNLVVVVKAESDKMRLQKSSSFSCDVADDRKITVLTEDKDQGENGGEKTMETQLADSGGYDVKIPEKTGAEAKSLKCRLKGVFKGPERGDDFTIPQALVSVDMLILFISTTCGVGTTLTAIDNMGQIGNALGYTPINISTFVSLISIWNFLGRVTSGYLSEILLQKYRFPRSLMFTIIMLVACIGHIFIAFALPGSLYVASVVIGFSFGAMWPVVFAIISELFGLKYYATLYNFGAAASPLGLYLLSVRIAGVLYDREARRQNGLAHKISVSTLMRLQAPVPAPAQNKLSCIGHECFRLSFIIMTLVELFGALVSGILVLRTRNFYRSDIYAKFRESPKTQENVKETNMEDKDDKIMGRQLQGNSI